MKLSTSFLLLILFCGCFVNAQEAAWCNNTLQNHWQQMEVNEAYKNRVVNWEKETSKIIATNEANKNPPCADGRLIIPIAVHFDVGFVPEEEEPCVITQVEDQIAELNLEIVGQDADAGLINQFTSCFGTDILGDACMQFCIANQDHPSGFGLQDGDLAITFGQLDFSVPPGNFTPVNPAWAGYVNVYVFDNDATTITGFSNGIPGFFNGDGVSLSSCVWGTGDVLCPSLESTGGAGCFFPLYNNGEILAHEIGHYFGLYHIYGDNNECTPPQDYIDDTPNMANQYTWYSGCGSHLTCADLPQTCGTEDMYMNFMSYAFDACRYMFTSDQAELMHATAVAQGFSTSSNKCGTIILESCDADYLVVNAISQDVYRAEINITSDAFVNNSVNEILFAAGQDIDLLPPFEVIVGTDFEARIQACDNTFQSPGDFNFLRYFLDESQDLEKLVYVELSNNQETLTIDQLRLAELNNHIRRLTNQFDKGIYTLRIENLQIKLEQQLVIIK